MVHLKIALKVSLQLESCLVPERFWKIFYGATGHGKDFKIGSAAFLFTLSLPLCLCVFEASRDLCVATTVKKRANPPRGRTEKTWLWFAASNQNATIITNQILPLSSVRVRQTNNDCAQAYLSLCSPILGSSSFPSACNHFWLTLTLCQYHHPRWRQSSTKICLLCRLQFCQADYLQAFMRNGLKNSRYDYLGGTGYFIFRIAWNLVIKWEFVHLLEMKNIKKSNKK